MEMISEREREQLEEFEEFEERVSIQGMLLCGCCSEDTTKQRECSEREIKREQVCVVIRRKLCTRYSTRTKKREETWSCTSAAVAAAASAKLKGLEATSKKGIPCKCVTFKAV